MSLVHWQAVGGMETTCGIFPAPDDDDEQTTGEPDLVNCPECRIRLCEGCGQGPIAGLSPDEIKLCQACLDLLEDEGREQAEKLAQFFHEAYERLAPQHGYETREASRKPWKDVPEQNRELMIAVCGEVLEHLGILS